LVIHSFRLPLLITIILFSITVIALLCQQLWARYLWIVSPCPEWVDQMWTSVGGGDGRGGSGNSQDGSGGNGIDGSGGNGKDSSGGNGNDGGRWHWFVSSISEVKIMWNITMP
jgi:hypothetical protein